MLIKNERIAIGMLLVVLTAACAHKPAVDAKADLEKRFQAMMSGVTLVGHSASPNQEGVSAEERYVIEKVTKLAGDTWLFEARVQYGSHDIPVPVPVQIKWAGDTPVITLTDLPIPGLGTFTARVLLYGDQYVGTWSGKDHGGQLFGKIVHQR
jgi:hypothetical protein